MSENVNPSFVELLTAVASGDPPDELPDEQLALIRATVQDRPGLAIDPAITRIEVALKISFLEP